MAANHNQIHLRDVEREELFTDDANDGEMPSIRPTANDHEASGSDKGVIELSSDEE